MTIKLERDLRSGLDAAMTIEPDPTITPVQQSPISEIVHPNTRWKKKVPLADGHYEVRDCVWHTISQPIASGTANRGEWREVEGPYQPLSFGLG